MLTPLETELLLAGIVLAVVVVARVRDWPPFRITKRPARNLSEQERRDVLIFHAIKQPSMSEPAKKGFAKNYQRHV